MQRLSVASCSLLCAAALSVTAPAAAASLIRCTAAGRQDVVMSLQDRQHRGRMLDYVSGDFVQDMTPCASPGVYGLSAPTGSAPLGPIVNRWQDYADHLGGVAGHYVTADRMTFFGGFNAPGQGYEESWTFIANRLTGAAELTEAGKPPVAFRCSKAVQKF